MRRSMTCRDYGRVGHLREDRVGHLGEDRVGHLGEDRVGHLGFHGRRAKGRRRPCVMIEVVKDEFVRQWVVLFALFVCVGVFWRPVVSESLMLRFTFLVWGAWSFGCFPLCTEALRACSLVLYVSACFGGQVVSESLML